MRKVTFLSPNSGLARRTPVRPPQPGEPAQTVTEEGFDLDDLDKTIEAHGQKAFELGHKLRRSGASVGEAETQKGRLMCAFEAAIEAAIHARVPTSDDMARLERLREDTVEKRKERDKLAAERRDALRKLDEAERKLHGAKGEVRAPTLLVLGVLGFLLAVLFAAVLVPTIPLLVPELKNEAGEMIPGGLLFTFLIGLGIGITVVTPSFVVALYHVDQFIVRYGPAVFGMAVVTGVGLLRYFQVGELNAAVVGLVTIETGVVAIVEVIAAVIRARYRDGVSGAREKQELALARRELEESEKSGKVAKANQALEKSKELLEQEGERLARNQTLVDKRKSFVKKGTTRVQERFSEGYSVGSTGNP
jgi:hypothetical protein